MKHSAYLQRKSIHRDTGRNYNTAGRSKRALTNFPPPRYIQNIDFIQGKISWPSAFSSPGDVRQGVQRAYGVHYFETPTFPGNADSAGADNLEIPDLMMIDGLELAQADRLIIADNCRAVPEDRIVVTHGTDTMVGTMARFLARRVEERPSS